MTQFAPRYRTFSGYLKETFGTRVWKIPVHAGLTCPNRDGSIGRGGCIYCNNAAFHPGLSTEDHSIAEQVLDGMELMRQRRGAGKFLVYFQTFTNTYGDLGTLKHLYDEAVQFPEVVGLIVGTRPDCVSGWVLDLLGSYIPRLQVWMEYGLQSMHNNTLRFLKRGHTFEDYLEAVRQTYDRNIPVCSHIILGLPGESREMMLQTAGTLCIPGVKAVKIHPLQVVRGTELEEMYARGEVSTLSLDRYLELVCDVLELLPSDLIIQRLTAESALDLLIAPRWGVGKAAVLHLIDETLRKRGTFQGTYYREGKTGPSHRKESD